MTRPFFRALTGWAVAAGLLGCVSEVPAGPPQVPHLIYLHGHIVPEAQSPRPRHPHYGSYELEAILAAFRERGFVVSGEIRPKSESQHDSVKRVTRQVRRLLASGVSADDITIVGASVGADIALRASARLRDPELRLALLGVCLAEHLSPLPDDGVTWPSGHVLSIREASDDPAGRCPPWGAEHAAPTGFLAREIVLHTGLAHGFLYRPLPEWVEPVARWAGGQEEAAVGAGARIPPATTSAP
jgi:hypothetical protein